jgi:hypothetical protein
MGVFPTSKADPKTPGGKRQSTSLDFSNLGPLKASGTVGFSAFRDSAADAAKRRKARKKSNGSLGGGGMDQDSDDDDDDDSDTKTPLDQMEDSEDKVVKTHLAPEDAQAAGELQAGIDRIRVRMANSRSDFPFSSVSTTALLPFADRPVVIAQETTLSRARQCCKLKEVSSRWPVPSCSRLDPK